jgi:hypothetical protein
VKVLFLSFETMPEIASHFRNEQKSSWDVQNPLEIALRRGFDGDLSRTAQGDFSLDAVEVILL